MPSHRRLQRIKSRQPSSLSSAFGPALRSSCLAPNFDLSTRVEASYPGLRFCRVNSMRIFPRLAVLLCLVFFASLATYAQTGASATEQQLFSLVNRARQQQNLPALRWNETLAATARRHAAVMAQHGVAEHVFAGEPTLASRATQAGLRFSWLAENVAQSAGIEAIHAEFQKSPNHRANMLDSGMDSIGIGVVERGGGSLPWKISARQSEE